MEKFNSGVNEYALGIPTAEEREQLISDGYMFFTMGKTKPDDGTEPKEYEIWFK